MLFFFPACVPLVACVRAKLDGKGLPFAKAFLKMSGAPNEGGFESLSAVQHRWLDWLDIRQLPLMDRSIKG